MKRTIRLYLSSALFLVLSAGACSGETKSPQRGTDDPQRSRDGSVDSDEVLDGAAGSANDTGTTEPPEASDQCPNNPDKAEPGFCGCDTPEGRCCDTLAGDFVKNLGAKYSLYRRPYSADLDIDELTPDDTQIVKIGHKADVSGDHFVVLKGYLKLDQGGSYEFSPGWGDSAFNVMTIAEQEVYRKNPGQQEGEKKSIYLSQGHHSFEIIFFKGMGELAIWMNGNRMDDTHLWHDRPFSKVTS